MICKLWVLFYIRFVDVVLFIEVFFNFQFIFLKSELFFFIFFWYEKEYNYGFSKIQIYKIFWLVFFMKFYFVRLILNQSYLFEKDLYIISYEIVYILKFFM